MICQWICVRNFLLQIQLQICKRFTGVCKFCTNFDGNLNACKLVCKRVANLSLANLIFVRRKTMGKFATQICNKFTGLQILRKSRWTFARAQNNMQIYGNFNSCKFNICAQANYRQIKSLDLQRVLHACRFLTNSIFRPVGVPTETD